MRTGISACGGSISRKPVLRQAPGGSIATDEGVIDATDEGLLKKSPEAGNGFPVGADLRVRPVVDADLVEVFLPLWCSSSRYPFDMRTSRLGRTRRSAPTKDANANSSSFFNKPLKGGSELQKRARKNRFSGIFQCSRQRRAVSRQTLHVSRSTSGKRDRI